MSEIKHRELYRKSLDSLKLYNPTKEDRKIPWDGFYHPFPAQVESTFPRYVAEKGMRELIDDMINAEEQAEIDKENEKRSKKGWLPMDPQERDKFDATKGLYTNNTELRRKYMKVIYRGIAEEFGLDQSPSFEVKPKDTRPVDEQLLEEIDNEMGYQSPQISEGENIESLKDNLVSEIGE